DRSAWSSRVIRASTSGSPQSLLPGQTTRTSPASSCQRGEGAPASAALLSTISAAPPSTAAHLLRRGQNTTAGLQVPVRSTGKSPRPRATAARFDLTPRAGSPEGQINTIIEVVQPMDSATDDRAIDDREQIPTESEPLSSPHRSSDRPGEQSANSEDIDEEVITLGYD